MQVLVITGLGGEPPFIEEFRTLGQSLSDAMHTRFAVPDSDITWLGEDSTGKSPHYRGLSNRENIQKAVARIAATAKPNEQVVIVLIGHGSGEGADTKLSIPGPDLATTDYKKLLDQLNAQHVAFVNLSTASGDMLSMLSGPNRVIITATKTAFERNESVFAKYFVEAFTKDGADTDKDGRVSLLEAFTYATSETKRFYTDAGKLQTEHAQLDDDGDGKGDPAPTGRTGDGMASRRFFLDAGAVASRVAAGSPALAALYNQRFALEEQVDSLKRLKPKMDPDEYDTALEKVLLDLARTSRDIRKMEGGGSWE